MSGCWMFSNLREVSTCSSGDWYPGVGRNVVMNADACSSKSGKKMVQVKLLQYFWKIYIWFNLCVTMSEIAFKDKQKYSP